MAETISSYTTFVQGTRARASEVNANFSNHRGSVIPIDPNTVAAADLTYNLGNSNYQWLNSYVQNYRYTTLTTTEELLVRDAGQTAALLRVEINSALVAAINASGVNQAYLNYNRSITNPTSATFSGPTSTEEALVTANTFTVGGFRATPLVEVTLVNRVTTGAGGGVRLSGGGTNSSATITLYVDNTASGQIRYSGLVDPGNHQVECGPGMFRWVHFPSAGASHQYAIKAAMETSGSLNFDSVRLLVREI